MSNQEQDTQGEIVASVRLPREQHARLRELAKGGHRTLSQELRMLVEQHLAEHDAPELRRAA